MDTRKIIGVTLLIVVVVALGVVIVKQMSRVSQAPTTMPSVPLTQVPAKTGLTEEPQLALLADIKAPATIDAIVNDMSSEVVTDQSSLDTETSSETSVLDQEASSLNDISQFYDEKSL